MSTPTTQRQPADRRATRRQAIIETAARLFAELGYASCEMERVAAEIGIAKGTLYLYFASKEELFYASVDHGMQQLQSAVEQAIKPVTDPFERIAAGTRAYLEFFEEHSQYAELLIQERANFKHRKRPTYYEYRDASRGPWRKLYRDLIAQGRVRGDLDVDRILDAIGNLLYGTMFTNHFIGRSVTPAEQCHAIVEIFLRGIQSDSHRAK
jgi:AcrR family transcriptional regulator